VKNLIQLLYLSKSAPGIGVADLADILVKSSRKNQALGITGVLCHKGGYFLQFLEGEENPVLELYLKIIRDPRHIDPVIVSISTATSQIFKGWAMGAIDEDHVPKEYGKEILKLRNSRTEQGKVLLMMVRLRDLLGS
jgi:hypothetical protein